MNSDYKHIAIFASGSGTNADSIMTHFAEHSFAKVGLIVCNNPSAGVIERAKKFGVPVFMITNSDLNSPKRLMEELEKFDIHFIALAGFMKLIPDEIVRKYHHRILNIHPALLPDFGGKGMYGMRVHEAVKAADADESGVTIHFVNEHYDEGNIFFQAKCAVNPEDTPDDISARVRKLELHHFPKVLDHLIEQTLEIEPTIKTQ